MAEYIEKDKAINAVFEAFADGRSAYVALEAIPSADVVPVRHGRLLNPNPYGECSLCGCLIDIRDAHHWCPNCGAKMDGGEE